MSREDFSLDRFVIFCRWVSLLVKGFSKLWEGSWSEKRIPTIRLVNFRQALDGILCGKRLFTICNLGSAIIESVKLVTDGCMREEDSWSHRWRDLDFGRSSIDSANLEWTVLGGKRVATAIAEEERRTRLGKFETFGVSNGKRVFNVGFCKWFFRQVWLGLGQAGRGKIFDCFRLRFSSLCMISC